MKAPPNEALTTSAPLSAAYRMACAARYTSTDSPLPATSGMICVPGASPTDPCPLSIRAATTPDTAVPCEPAAPLSMSGLPVQKFQPWQSPTLPLPLVSRVPHASAGLVHRAPARSGWSESKPVSTTATTVPCPWVTAQPVGASTSAPAVAAFW